MMDARRGGGEQRGAGAQMRTGTRLKVEGDVVMEDTDENPKPSAQDQRRGRGEKGRRSTGAQESAEEATGQWDARRIVGTASRVGQIGQQTGSSIGVWYSDGAEPKVVTGVKRQRRREGALCPSGAARRQGSGLQLGGWQEGAALKTLSFRAPCFRPPLDSPLWLTSLYRSRQWTPDSLVPLPLLVGEHLVRQVGNERITAVRVQTAAEHTRWLDGQIRCKGGLENSFRGACTCFVFCVMNLVT